MDRTVHADHGAVFGAVAGRRVPLHYGRPARTHRAVRNAAGVVDAPREVLVVGGPDRRRFLRSELGDRVPDGEDRGRYALLLDRDRGGGTDGGPARIRADAHVYDAGDRYLLVVPPGTAPSLAADWSAAAARADRDVEVRSATGRFDVFGVHGPRATEAVATDLVGAAAPDRSLAVVRGAVAGAGVTVVRTDAPTGEEGYEVVCAAADGAAVFRELVAGGGAAAPFGYLTWAVLTVEAGTPLPPELRGRRPATVGLARFGPDGDAPSPSGSDGDGPDAVDRRLVTLTAAERPPPGTRLVAGAGDDSDRASGDDSDRASGDDSDRASGDDPDRASGDDSARVAGVDAGADRGPGGAARDDRPATVGRVLRAVPAPGIDGVAAWALVDRRSLPPPDGGVGVALALRGRRPPAALRWPPLVEGSERSARRPSFPDR